MTTPVPGPQPVPATHWPAVFDGIGALVVDSSAADPTVLVDKIRRHSPGLSWIAPKVNGADTGGAAAILHSVTVWRQLNLQVGAWIYNTGPPDVDVVAGNPAILTPAFVIYDVEAPYKSDEGGSYVWARQLVEQHEWRDVHVPAAVTSYGGYKTSIDFGSFAAAGWPILAQVYDAFHDGDELTYSLVHGGPYPTAGIHRLTRRLTLQAGESVYRPESIDE